MNSGEEEPKHSSLRNWLVFIGVFLHKITFATRCVPSPVRVTDLGTLQYLANCTNKERLSLALQTSCVQ